jgi:hypothetical protein
MAHSYARLVGARLHWTRLTWHEVRVVARHEWPLAGAAFPAAAVAVFGLLTGMPDRTTAWFCLGVAVAGQVGWAVAAAAAAGTSRQLIVSSAAVDLLMGSLIVVMKAAFAH